MHKVVTAAVAALALAACSRHDGPTLEAPWVRLAAVPGRPAAAYFTIHGGGAPAVLRAVSVAGVARAELHESRMAAGGQGMTMDAIGDVAVPAGGRVTFAPMGRHVMLFGVPAAMTPGGTARITLRFADGHTVAADAPVMGAGDPGPR